MAMSTELLKKDTELVLEIQLCIACFSVLINVFHLFILTRKSMRINCVNVLMAGIAICDIYDMGFLIYDDWFNLTNLKSDECAGPHNLTYLLIEHFFAILEDGLHRLSIWLGTFMATIRYLCIKNALNSKFPNISKPGFGLKAILIAFVVSTLATIFWFGHAKFERVEVPDMCKTLAPDETWYTKRMNQQLVFRVFVILDGTLKIVPAFILLPLLSVLLIRELRNAEKARKASSVAKAETSSSKTDQTTKLVILMTISFMLAEGPFGVFYIMNGLIEENSALVPNMGPPNFYGSP